MKTKDLILWDSLAAARDSTSDPINIELREGEILGVTGLDGHGHDEFVKILAGVQEPHAGTTEVLNINDEFVKYNTLMEAKKLGISFVSGDRKKEGILPNLSIYENMVIPLYRTTSRAGFLGFINWLELNGVYEWELDRLNIKTGFKSDLITSLSGGNQQKVMIARSFGQHPKTLILNDPARGIDVNTKKDLYIHLRNYVEEGNSVVFLSSELEEFIGFCSKVLVFRHGGVFDIFENEKVNADSLLQGMFGQTQGIGSTSISKSNNTSISEKVKDTNTNLSNVDASDKKIIKIVDFDKEKKLREEGIQKKIKVKYF